MRESTRRRLDGLEREERNRVVAVLAAMIVLAGAVIAVNSLVLAESDETRTHMGKVAAMTRTEGHTGGKAALTVRLVNGEVVGLFASMMTPCQLGDAVTVVERRGWLGTRTWMAQCLSSEAGE